MTFTRSNPYHSYNVILFAFYCFSIYPVLKNNGGQKSSALSKIKTKTVALEYVGSYSLLVYLQLKQCHFHLRMPLILEVVVDIFCKISTAFL